MTITTVEEMEQYPFDAYELTDEDIWAIVKPALQRSMSRLKFWLLYFEFPTDGREHLKVRAIRNFRGYILEAIEDLQEQYFLELEIKDRDELHLSFFPQPSAAWQLYQPEITSGGFRPGP